MIEVRIPVAALDRLDNEVHKGMHVLGKLRDAGMPVEGVLYVRGVRTGVLEVEFDDLATEEWVYRWRA